VIARLRGAGGAHPAAANTTGTRSSSQTTAIASDTAASRAPRSAAA
jgi:hypothetical protein